MGAFLGAGYVRTEDRDKVRRVLEEIARKNKSRFLLAPLIRGWVGVYPQNGGQDPKISKTLAKRLDADVLHVLVHDDDIFCYYFYRSDRLVDECNSRPDYFHSVSDKERGKQRGRPELLIDLLSDKNAVNALHILLHETERPVFASETMERFAELLQLPNALTSYDYLVGEETEGIERWEEFVHVPDLSAEKAAKRAEEDADSAAKKHLKDKGLLLAEITPSGKRVSTEQLCFCPDRQGNGFLVSSANLMSPKEGSLRRYGPPWSAGPQAVEIGIDSSIWMLHASPSGRYLLAGNDGNAAKAQLWDWVENALVLEVSHARGVTWAEFTPDEKILVSRSTEEVTVTSLENRKTLATYPVIGHGQRAALHPSGKKLVVDTKVNLGILDLDSGRFKSPLCIGERHDLTEQTLWRARQMIEVEAKVDYEAMEQQLKKTLKKTGMDESAIHEHLERHFKQMKDEAARVGTPEWLAEQSPIQGSERPYAMAFSPDGSLFFCATSHGIRVYSWEQMLIAGEQMPPPVITASGKSSTGETNYGQLSYIYALAHDPKTHRILFSGLGGAIEYLELHSGSCGTLIEPPGQPAIHCLAFSRDGSALAYQAAGGRHRPPTIQIWNYASLQSLAE